MTEDLEQRFRQACSAYIEAAEEHDRACGAEALAFQRARAARQLADEARDELLQVVRERDLQAQLEAGQTVVYPSGRAAAARDAWLPAQGGEAAVRRRLAAGPLDVFLSHYPPAAPGGADDPPADGIQLYDERGRPAIDDD